MDNNHRNSSRRWSFTKIDAALFLAAVVLYLPGIWWGLPYASSTGHKLPWGVDEIGPMEPVTEVYGVFFGHHPVFNPKYPLFQAMIEALFVAPYYLWLFLSGGLRHPTPVFPYGLADPISALRTATLLARLPNVLMAAGLVVIAYRTARQLWGAAPGVLAGLFVMTTYPFIYYARTSNVDMGALFWTALGLWVFGEAIEEGLTRRRTIWLAVFAALATGTKESSWPAFLGMGIVLLFLEFRRVRRAGASVAPLLWNIAIGVSASGLLWTMASGLLFRPSRYIQRLHFMYIRPTAGGWPVHRSAILGHPATMSGYGALAGDSFQSLTDSLGIPILLCAAAGITLCLLSNRKTLYWLCPPIAVLLLDVLPVRWVMVRLVMLVAYVLALFAAFAIREASRLGYRSAARVVAVIAIGWSMVRGSDLTYQMMFDSRYEAAQWLHRNAHPGDRLLHYTDIANLPALDPGISCIRDLPGSGFYTGKPNTETAYEFRGNSQDPEFVIVLPIGHIPSEVWYEHAIPQGEYEKLRNGSLGYVEVLAWQAPRLFQHRPIPFVNPHVLLFERRDLVAERGTRAQFY